MKSLLTLLIGLLFFISCSNIKKLERQADKGDLNACYQIVTLYASSDYSPTDKKAQEKIIKYSKKGLTIPVDTSKYNMDDFYGTFYGEIAKSFLTKETEKKFYYQKAAQYGNGESQWIVGLIYMDGRGIKINTDSAYYWIKKTYEGNDFHYSAIAADQLGDFYMEGKLVKADTLTALYYYKKSCACYREYSDALACDKVITFYKNQKNLKDTTELAIYSELARQLRKMHTAK
jgi:TPR repeat protein